MNERAAGTPRSDDSDDDHRVRVGAQRRERMRARLIEAAMRVYARRGPPGSVIDEVVALAEVSRGSLYNHFRTPEALLTAVATEAGDQLVAAVEPRVRSQDDPAMRVATGVRMTLRVALDFPVLAAFLARVGPAAVGPGTLAVESVARDLALGIERGRFGAIDLETGVDLVVGPVLLGFQRIANGSIPTDYPERLAESILRALGTQAAVARRFSQRPLAPIDMPPDSLIARVQSASNRPRRRGARPTHGG